MRGSLDYWANAASTRPALERLASLQPTTLACMHGSAWTGDGAGLIRELAAIVSEPRRTRVDRAQADTARRRSHDCHTCPAAHVTRASFPDALVK